MISLQDALLKMVLNVKTVYINMLHSVMIDRIMSDTDSRFVVATDVNRLDVRNLSFVQDIPNPHDFINAHGHGTKFGFYTRLRD